MSALYIHFPWCLKKCPYCDFNSHTLKTPLPEKAYIKKLIQDLDQLPKILYQRPITSIFMGGGTPSLFSATAIGGLLKEIKNRFHVEDDAECTMEANPGSMESDLFSAYVDQGVNRLSLGAQSFNDAHLKTLGRIHDGARVVKAMTALSKLDVIYNIDLMMGLSKQTLEEAMEDLECALSFRPHHLSWYQLTLEPNTLYYHQPPPLPDEELLWEMMMQGRALLKHHGYHAYEISAYARNDHRCQHNLHAWQYGDYIGIGAGAHSKWTDEHGNVYRSLRQRHPKSYMSMKDTTLQVTRIPPSQQVFEYYLNRMRLYQPLSIKHIAQTIGHQVAAQESPYKEAIAQGMIEIKEDTMMITELGYRFYNDLVGMFLVEEKA